MRWSGYGADRKYLAFIRWFIYNFLNHLASTPEMVSEPRKLIVLAVDLAVPGHECSEADTCCRAPQISSRAFHAGNMVHCFNVEDLMSGGELQIRCFVARCDKLEVSDSTILSPQQDPSDGYNSKNRYWSTPLRY
jgi:hypothetical protein